MSNLAQPAADIAHQDPIAPVIFSVTMVLVVALVGRHFARKWHRPTVLGELLMGVLLGIALYC